MPYDSDGNWIPPEGFEDYDQDEMFAQATGADTGSTLIEDFITSTPQWSGFEDTWEGNISDIWSEWIFTPYDWGEQSDIKRKSEQELRASRDAMFAQTTQISNLTRKGGFASSYAGASQTRSLWTDYLNKQREIKKAKSLSLYKSRGDYLDSFFGELAQQWDLALGEGE